MSRVILLNGTPGTGKSTVAALWQQAQPGRNLVEVDRIKHVDPLWPDDPQRAGLNARVLALAAVAACIDENADVILPQYLARPDFADALAEAAAARGADSVEVLLELSADQVAQRLTARRQNPDRVEQIENDKGVSPDEAAELVAGIEAWKADRPQVITVDATGSPDEVVARLEAAIG